MDKLIVSPYEHRFKRIKKRKIQTKVEALRFPPIIYNVRAYIKIYVVSCHAHHTDTDTPGSFAPHTWLFCLEELTL